MEAKRHIKRSIQEYFNKYVRTITKDYSMDILNRFIIKMHSSMAYFSFNPLTPELISVLIS